ncbi:hypothetical protein AB0K14_26440 [Actinosynnema sp. NPDC050801]|uniref:hypothetical protein n=1 Tax=unclassified Actinosynnema TaxID=2637065 RepID=UPI0033D5561A
MAALVFALVPPAVVTTGCGLGCGYALAVEPVTVEGHGAPRVDLELTARLTDDGKPVPGVNVEFAALGANGVVLGYVTTDADGVARLVKDDGAGPESIDGHNADKWTEYQAKVFPFQTGEGAGDAVCAEPATAPFRFKP